MTALKRNVLSKINTLLEIFPIVLVIGPRQCGKSFLVKNFFSDWSYFDLENSKDYEFITGDFSLFFSEYNNKVIIDEAQESSEFLKNLRGEVDKTAGAKGRYILTGSSSPELIKQISETLAGRVGIVELGTFKFNEFAEKPLSNFYKIFEKEITNKTIDMIKEIEFNSGNDNIDYFFNGGYPDPFFIKNDKVARELWFQNYHDTYINRDLKKLFPKLDSIRFRRFLSMLTDLSGTIINKSQLGRSVDISETSIRDYLEIAHKTFIWRIIPSFEKSKSKSITKMPKGIFRDSGLNLFLSGVDTREKLIRSSRVGQNFESFVIEEIIKALESTTITNWNYSYFRTKNGAEIDLVLDGNFGILPIEIKWGTSTPIRTLKSLVQFIELHDLPLGIVINNSDEIKLLHQKIIQIPVSCI